jgi:hypothetical protein
MDDDKLKKPAHVKAHIWHQHLNWLDVLGKQVEENIKRRKAQSERENASRR